MAEGVPIMDAQYFLTLSFEFVAVIPLVLMVVDFLLNKNDSLATEKAFSNKNPLSTVPDGTNENKTDVVENKVQGWDYVQPGTDWQEWNCPLPVTTTYWRKADARIPLESLQQQSIRQLKKLASEAHIAILIDF
jgi:hypothetical protein